MIEQIDDGHRRLNAFGAAGARQLVKGSEELQIFFGRQFVVQRIRLGHIADFLQHFELRHRLAQHADGAAVGYVDTGNQLDQRRFAGARRAQQAEQLPAFDAHRNPVQYGATAESPGNVAKLDSGGQGFVNRRNGHLHALLNCE
ncbi:MAG: hypothetical protein K0R28_6851 [Paenibacillus sp.]|nr:hypothetical protein [Paenibacillus sp.]